MNSWWRAFYGRFNDKECDWLIDYALQLPAVQGQIGHGGTFSTTNKELRESTLRWLKRDDPSLHWLYQRIETLALTANTEAFGFDVKGFYEIQFTEYDASNSGHYNWHEDNTWKINKPYDRKLSMVIQLSNKEDYEGGRLELANDPLPDNVFRNRGDVIVFPSFNKHRVTNLTKGKRYSLVTWFVGPKFK